MKRLALALILAVLGSVAAGATPAHAAALPATPPGPAPTCTTADILAFRGSGETRLPTKGVYKTLTTTGYEGHHGRLALKALEAAAPGEKVDLRGVKVLDIDYEAIAVSPDSHTKLSESAVGRGVSYAIGHGLLIGQASKAAGVTVAVLGSYSYTLAEVLRSSRDGVRKGLAAKQQAIRSTPHDCRVPAMLSIGYSQGAMANRQLIAEDTTGAGRIQAALDFGDPFQMGVSGADEQMRRGLHGSGASGTGMFITSRHWVDAVNRRVDWIPYEKLSRFYSQPVHRYTLCHKRDPFCDFSTVFGLVDGSTSQHTSYFEDTQANRQEASAAGRWLAEQLQASSRFVDDNRDPDPTRYGKLFFWPPDVMVAAGSPVPLYIEGGGISRTSDVKVRFVRTYPDFDGYDPIWDRLNGADVTSLMAKPGPGTAASEYDLPVYVKVTHHLDIPADFPPGFYFMVITTPLSRWAEEVRVDDGAPDYQNYQTRTESAYKQTLAAERRHKQDGIAPEFPYGTPGH